MKTISLRLIGLISAGESQPHNGGHWPSRPFCKAKKAPKMKATIYIILHKIKIHNFSILVPQDSVHREVQL